MGPHVIHLLCSSTSGIRKFRDACAGAIENCLKRLLGLPISASLNPERALRALSSKVRRAKFEQFCKLCSCRIHMGDPIVESAHGWTHAACMGFSNAPVNQPTRRGGM